MRQIAKGTEMGQRRLDSNYQNFHQDRRAGMAACLVPLVPAGVGRAGRLGHAPALAVRKAPDRCSGRFPGYPYPSLEQMEYFPLPVPWRSIGLETGNGGA